MTPTNDTGNKGNELSFGCLNVCGLKRRVHFPEFQETLSDFDILCVSETKLDLTYIIMLPGFGSLSQVLKQKFIRCSGGIAVIYKNSFEGKTKAIPTESDYGL